MRTDHGPARPGAHHARLLEGLPVAERRLEIPHVSTSVLEGGAGPPVVLLHGQGGFAAMWGPTLVNLARDHRVVAPDLPGLGRSVAGDVPLDAPALNAWLSELIDRTCAEPPVLVGHSLGGSIAARFALAHGNRLARLVLVDSGSLGPFRPALAFLLSLARFSARPSAKSHARFLRRVFVDPDRARSAWGDRWADFEAYHVALAGDERVQAANRELLMHVGVRRIPPGELARIRVPVALVWGREDPVMPVRIAEQASRELNWLLYVIEDCGHVPQVERPRAFGEALRAAMGLDTPLPTPRPSLSPPPAP